MAYNVRLVGSFLSDLATATATSTAAGYDVDNVVGLDRTAVWIAGGTGAINLTLDLGSAETVSAVCIANHNGHLWTGGALHASTDNFGASDVTVATFSGMASGEDYYHVFSGVSYRYWRIVTTGSSPSAMQVGIFYLGLSTELTLNPWIGAESEDVYNVERATAQSGAIVAEQWGRRLIRESMRWDVVATAVKDQLRDFLRIEGGSLRPFWYIPRADSSSPVSGRAYLVRMELGGFKVQEIFSGLWSMALAFREEV